MSAPSFDSSSSGEPNEVDLAIAEWIQALTRGEQPDRDDFLKRHVHLRAELVEFLNDYDAMRLHIRNPPSERDAKSFPLSAFADIPTINSASEVSATQLKETSKKVRYFGDFELVREIARGGMGVVYEARQCSLNRSVALKMILAGRLADAKDVSRFRREAEASAKLEHPGIVPIYEIGTHDDQYYFSMGYVAGPSLSARLLERPLEPREAATLIRDVALAVQFAHERGVVHRDLKPSNILLAPRTERLQGDFPYTPRVTDFGLAKLSSSQSDHSLTETGQIIGTPSYMPPEQAAGLVHEVGPTADVYALGAVFYACLTGRPPFQAASALDTVRQVIERDPVSLRDLNAAIPADLETIALKCLEKSIPKRYPTAKALADDLQRYLDGRPIEARPVSRFEHVLRWCQRNPVVSILSTTAAVFLIAGTVVSTMQAIRATKAEQDQIRLRGIADDQLTKAEEQRDRADTQKRLADKNAARADAEKQRAVEQETAARNAETFAKEQEQLARRRLYAAQMNLAQQAWEQEDPGRVLELLEGQRPTIGEEDPRGFEWYYLWHLCHRGRRLIGSLPGTKIAAMALSPDGRTLVICGESGDPLAFWDIKEAKVIATLPDRDISTFAVSPDGQLLATGNLTNQVTLWNFATRQPQKKLVTASGAFARCLVFSPDGKSLVAGDDYGVATIWDLATFETLANFNAQKSAVMNMAFSPDGKILAATSIWNEKGVRLWDVSTRPVKLLRTLKGVDAACVAFSPTGDTLAVAPEEGTVATYDVATGEVKAIYPGFRRPNHQSIAFSRDGNTIAFAGAERTVNLWQPSTGRAWGFAHGATSGRVVFSVDGKTIITGDDNGCIQSWELEIPKDELVIQPANSDSGIAFSADGRFLAHIELYGIVKLWDLQLQRQHAVIPTGTNIFNIEFSPSGLVLACAAKDGTVRLYDFDNSGNETILRGHEETAYDLTFSPDSKNLISYSIRSLICWDWRPPQPHIRYQITLEGSGLIDVLVSSDSKTVITVSGDGLVRELDIDTGKERFQLKSGMDQVSNAAISPDGNTLALARKFGDLSLWDLATRTSVKTFRGHNGRVDSVKFFKNGETLASCDSGGTLILWDVRTGQQQFMMKGQSRGGNVAISPDGTALAIACYDELKRGTVKLWKTAPDHDAIVRKTHFENSDFDTPSKQLRLAALLIFQGDFGQAEESYRQAIIIWDRLVREKPESLIYKKELAEALVRLGWVQRASSRYSEAEVSYRRALEIYRTSDLRSAGTIPTEIDSVISQLELDLASLLEVMDHSADESTRAEQVTAFWRRMVAEHPEDLNARLRLAQNLERVGAKDEATVVYSQALKKWPGDISLKNQSNALRKQSVDNYLSTSAWQGPLEKYAKASNNPQFVNDFSLKVVERLQKEGSSTDAEAVVAETAEELVKSIEWKDPQDGRAWFLFGISASKNGDKDRAIKWFDAGCLWMGKQALSDNDMLQLRSDAARIIGIHERAIVTERKITDSEIHEALSLARDARRSVIGTMPQPATNEKTPVLSDAELNAQLTQDPVVFLRFDKADFFTHDTETFVRDVSGHHRHAICNDVHPASGGLVGGCLKNNGLGYLALPRTLITNQEDATIVGWVRQSTAARAIDFYHTSFEPYRSNCTFNLMLESDRRFVAGIWNIDYPDGWMHVITHGNLSVNGWTLLAFRIKNGGTTETTCSFTVNDSTVDATMQMSKDPLWKLKSDFIASHLYGLLDEFGLWHRYLSDDELDYLYRIGRNGKSLFDDIAPPDDSPPQFPDEGRPQTDFELQRIESAIEQTEVEQATSRSLTNGDFSAGLDGWRVEGRGAEFSPFLMANEPALTTYGKSFEAVTGRLSQSFRIPDDATELRFAIHGGEDLEKLYVALWNGNRIHRIVTAKIDNIPTVVRWDISALRGKVVTLEIVDEATGPWGFIGVQNFVIATNPPSTISQTELGYVNRQGQIVCHHFSDGHQSSIRCAKGNPRWIKWSELDQSLFALVDFEVVRLMNNKDDREEIFCKFETEPSPQISITADEKQLAWCGKVAGDPLQHVLIRHMDGSPQRDLGHGFDPVWTPDGTRLVFVTRPEEGWIIKVWDGATVNPLTPPIVGQGGLFPAVSPDGKSIAFGGVGPHNKLQIVSTGIDGGHFRHITRDWVVNTNAEFSPDGRYIAFSQLTGFTLQLTYVDLETEREVLIADDAGGGRLTWRRAPQEP